MQNMVVDLLFLAFAAWGFFLGFNRGIINTVFTILSYTLGFTASVKFAPMMTDVLENLFSTENPLMFLVGFILCFILFMLAIRSVANVLEGALEAANINLINKAIGGGVLAGVMILIYSVGLGWAVDSGTIDRGVTIDSLTYPIIKEYPEQVWKLIEAFKPTFQEFWDDMIDFLDGLRDMSTQSIESERRIRDQ
jgi:membrane protein required for colicin V production